MRLYAEKQACPRRRNPPVVKTMLSRRQTERSGKAFWDTKQSDRHLPSCCNAPIASQPLLPGETIMRALCAGEDHFRFAWRSGGRRQRAHLDALVSHELQTGAPVFSPTPIPPEQRSRTHLERMQQHADLAGLCGGVAIPLALLAQPTGTTTANAGSIHHA